MEIELLPGEELCPKCDGVGEIIPAKEHFGLQVCDRCFGDGKLDWIEMAMGKPMPQYGSASSSSCSSTGQSTKRQEGVYNGTKRLHSRRIRNPSDDFRQFHVRQKRPLERQLHKERRW